MENPPSVAQPPAGAAALAAPAVTVSNAAVAANTDKERAACLIVFRISSFRIRMGQPRIWLSPEWEPTTRSTQPSVLKIGSEQTIATVGPGVEPAGEFVALLKDLTNAEEGFVEDELLFSDRADPVAVGEDGLVRNAGVPTGQREVE
jgi:hypothetical protein